MQYNANSDTSTSTMVTNIVLYSSPTVQTREKKEESSHEEKKRNDVRSDTHTPVLAARFSPPSVCSPQGTTALQYLVPPQC